MSWDSISPWEYIWVLFGLISSLVHCVSLFAILKARRTRASSLFSGPFFTIYLIQGSHELIVFFTTNLINRPRKYHLIQYAMVDNNGIIEWEYYWFIFFRNLLYLGNVLVAVNRVSAFLVTTMSSYDRLWKTSHILLVTLVSYLLNAALRFVEYSPEQKYTPFVDNTTDIFSFTIDAYVIQFDGWSDIFLSVTTATICVTCYTLAALQARKASELVVQYKKQEVMLLRVGIATFLMFLPVVIRSILELIAIAVQDAGLKLTTSRAATICIEAMFVFNPWLLLIACPSLRERVLLLVRLKSTRPELSIGSQDHQRSAPNHTVTVIS